MVLNLFLPPTLPPAPLCPPPGAERGALIWFRRADYASTARGVATASSRSDFGACGRRELARICTPRLAAAPASDETNCKNTPHSACLVHSRSRSDRCPWHANAQPLTTTAGQQSRLTVHGGDAPHRRSLSRIQKQNPGSPLYPGGGREGRGGVWGADQPSQTQKAGLRKESRR